MSNIPGVHAVPVKGISDQTTESSIARKSPRQVPGDGKHEHVTKETVKSSSTSSQPTITKETLDHQEVQQLADEMAEAIAVAGFEPRDVNLRYEVDANVFVIEVKEPETGELIMQFPPEELISMRERMDELIGMFIDRMS